MGSKNINKIIYYLLLLTKKGVPKEKIIQISNDEIRCLTKEEIHIKKLINTFNHLFNNINQTFNKTIIKELYFLLTNELINENLLNEIIDLYYKNLDYSPYYLISILHLFIIEKFKSIDFAFVISEFIIFKKNKTLIIPLEYIKVEYRNAITSKNISELIKVFYEIEFKDKKIIPCKLNKEEIIQTIKTLKEELINQFLIEKIYLFGSFVKNTNNENSDIDFLVVFQNDLINFEKNNQIEKLKNYLSMKLECSVDVVDFTFALNELGKNEVESTIMII